MEGIKIVTVTSEIIENLQIEKQLLVDQLRQRKIDIRQHAEGGCQYYAPYIHLIMDTSGEDFFITRKFGSTEGKRAERDGVKILTSGKGNNIAVFYQDQCVLSDSGNNIEDGVPGLLYQSGEWEQIIEGWYQELKTSEQQRLVDELNKELENLEAEISALPQSEIVSGDIAFPIGTVVSYKRNGDEQLATIKTAIPRLKLYQVKEFNGWVAEERLSVLPPTVEEEAPLEVAEYYQHKYEPYEPTEDGGFAPGQTITLPDHRLHAIYEEGLSFEVIHHTREWINDEADYAHFYLVRITKPVFA
jgi:hypothetical protein